MRTCEMVALAFGDVWEEYRNPHAIKNEFVYGKTSVRDLLQEQSGNLTAEEVSRLAGRCTVWGSLAAVAGYGMEHFLIKNKVG